MYCISKFGQELQRLLIPQLIAHITLAFNHARSIVPSCKHLQFTCNTWGQLQFIFSIVTALQVIVSLNNYWSKL